MKQQESDLSPQSCDVFGQQECLTKSCEKPRTAATQTRNGSVKTEASFYSQFSEELNI